VVGDADGVDEGLLEGKDVGSSDIDGEDEGNLLIEGDPEG
jgi:hypothetical protein